MHGSSTKNNQIYISHIISIDIPTVDQNFFTEYEICYY